MNTYAHTRRVFSCLVFAGTSLFVSKGYSNANDECIWNSATKQCTPDAQLYMQPIAHLEPDQMQLHEAGKNQFNTVWTFAPRLDGVWGMGPFFLANACSGCHINNGRGLTTEQLNKPVFQQLVRLSVRIPGTDETMPHPAYDSQLQVFAFEGGLVEPNFATFLHSLQQTTHNLSRSGPTLSRPTSKLDGRWIGMNFYDTTLGKQINLHSVNPDVWHDGRGT